MFIKHRGSLWALLAFVFLTLPVMAEVEPTSGTLTVQVDPGAQVFLNRCAGCHTVGNGALSGPDLLPATRWTTEDLFPAIKRMEPRTGPLKDQDINAIIEMFHSGDAVGRLQKQEQATAAMNAANMPAPSAAMGRALFQGTRVLQNGGPSCISCHAVDGIGGNLGLDLSTVGSRFTETALRAGIEKAGYLVMQPIYEAHPIAPQEAADLTAYFQEAAAAGEVKKKEFPAAMTGLAAAFFSLGLLTLVGRRHAYGVRRRLLQEANKR